MDASWALGLALSRTHGQENCTTKIETHCTLRVHSIWPSMPGQHRNIRASGFKRKANHAGNSLLRPRVGSPSWSRHSKTVTSRQNHVINFFWPWSWTSFIFHKKSVYCSFPVQTWFKNCNIVTKRLVLTQFDQHHTTDMNCTGKQLFVKAHISKIPILLT